MRRQLKASSAGPGSRMTGHRGAALLCGLVVLAVFAFGGSGADAATCPNEAIRAQQNSAKLPDCRAYEMVTPLDKNGADIFPLTLTQVATSGEKIYYNSQAAFEGSISATANNGYIGERGADGWTARSIAPPQESSFYSLLRTPGVLALTPDLSKAIVKTGNPPLATGAPTNVTNFYVRNNEDNTYRTVTTVGPSGPAPFYVPTYSGGSSDLSSVIFESSEKLTPEAPEGVTNLYLWRDGQLSLASLLEGGEPAPGGAFAGAGTGTAANNRTMSADGSRYFFTDAASGQLYVSENGHSTRVSASQRTEPDPNGVKPAHFQTATADGSKVFFISAEKLTNDATTGPESTGGDLYSYDTNSGELLDLTVDHNAADPLGAQAQGVVGASDDGSRVYFAAQGDLTESGATGTSLYVWDRATVGYIASGADGPNWATEYSTSTHSNTVTPDGGHMLFVTREQLTAYDNAGFWEWYLYSLGEESFECVSCGKPGEVATADATLNNSTQPLGTPFPGPEVPTANLSPDGESVFFNSREPLSPEDTNGRYDVYEWTPTGVHLVSGGDADTDSFFFNASPDRRNVFFETRQQLVGSDTDALIDIYDARVEGGFAEEAGFNEQECLGETCRPAATPPPSTPGAGTATLAGQPNTVPKRPRKPRHHKPHHKHKKHLKHKAKKHKKQRHAPATSRRG